MGQLASLPGAALAPGGFPLILLVGEQHLGVLRPSTMGWEHRQGFSPAQVASLLSWPQSSGEDLYFPF